MNDVDVLRNWIERAPDNRAILTHLARRRELSNRLVNLDGVILDPNDANSDIANVLITSPGQVLRGHQGHADFVRACSLWAFLGSDSLLVPIFDTLRPIRTDVVVSTAKAPAVLALPQESKSVRQVWRKSIQPSLDSPWVVLRVMGGAPVVAYRERAATAPAVCRETGPAQLPGHSPRSRSARAQLTLLGCGA